MSQLSPRNEKQNFILAEEKKFPCIFFLKVKDLCIVFILQLALRIPMFCIHRFSQPQVESIWGGNPTKFQRAKLEFAPHPPALRLMPLSRVACVRAPSPFYRGRSCADCHSREGSLSAPGSQPLARPGTTVVVETFAALEGKVFKTYCVFYLE